MRKFSQLILCVISLFVIPAALHGNHPFGSEDPDPGSDDVYTSDCWDEYRCYEKCPRSSNEFKSYQDSVFIYGTYSFGESPGICENYGTVGLFRAPCLNPCCIIPVLDVSYNYLHDGKYGASAGLGFRIASSDPCTYGGGLISYDYLKGDCGGYHQIAFSAELIGNRFEARANGYFPFSQTSSKGPLTVYDDYDNTGVTTPYIVTVFKKEFALKGFDTEVGPRLCFRCMDAFIGVGPYYFGHHHYDYWGIRGVFRGEFSHFIYFEGQVTHDNENRTLGRGTVGISLPIDRLCNPRKLFSCGCKTQRPFYRNKPIHLEHCCHYTTNY